MAVAPPEPTPEVLLNPDELLPPSPATEGSTPSVALLDSLPLPAVMAEALAAIDPEQPEEDVLYALPDSPEPSYSSVAKHIEDTLIGLLDDLTLPERHRPQADALLEVVHLVEVVAPAAVDNAEHHAALELAHRGGAERRLTAAVGQKAVQDLYPDASLLEANLCVGGQPWHVDALPTKGRNRLRREHVDLLMNRDGASICTAVAHRMSYKNQLVTD